MKQSPSNLKFKKYHKVPSCFLKLKTQKLFVPLSGLYALKSIKAGKLTVKQIESARRAIRRTTKKDGKIFIKIFPSFSISKKPVSVRMGKGKGNHSYWVCPIKKGQILYELSGLPSEIAKRALIKAGTKIPVKTSVVKLIY